MAQLCVLLFICSAFAGQAVTSLKVSEAMAFDLGRENRKLIESQVITANANNYDPGKVMTGAAEERSIGAWPLSMGVVALLSPRTVRPDTPFDGGMRTFKRSNVAYQSGVKMRRADAVFVVQAGGTLSNVIIAGGGGVYCETHNCALVNVWFKDSVQGALHINSGTGITTVTGGGARNVARRIIFGQASGTVVISGGFYMINSGRLFESCGTCGPVKRAVVVDGVVNINPTSELIRMNANYNDRGTISKARISTPMTNYPVCLAFNGGAIPTMLGNGASVCAYANAAVTIIQTA
ncbi:RxLR-like protein [Plasmopara halstedii]|uniref:Probable pectate lyase F n=1 Tax=Plasmopara halstedii TaxID=4781 RepID=A0A0P1B155_PLAHL|nr:RxLR-like protein [Plasmopara halstedii]CEG47028.1 RxLR-like protein [Plasmopara halstedii]|eukprot:XP_024583397.1 RxLR-like protein [Plasmopara halstedii]